MSANEEKKHINFL